MVSISVQTHLGLMVLAVLHRMGVVLHFAYGKIYLNPRPDVRRLRLLTSELILPLRGERPAREALRGFTLGTWTLV